MKQLSDHIRAILGNIPESPGVYRYYDSEGVIIYVGKAKNLKRRVNSYFNKDHDTYKTNQLVKHIADIQYLVVDSEQDAFLLENNLIKQYQPHYNILLKDGKTYPSICITKEDFPKVIKTRVIDKTNGEYYGPYTFSYAVDSVMEIIHKLCPLRTCAGKYTVESVQNGKHKVCLKYHLGKCCGICEGKCSQEQYMQYVNMARTIIRGDGHLLEKQLRDKMLAYSAKMEYEKAAQEKFKLDQLENFTSKNVITNTNTGDIDVVGFGELDDTIIIAMLHLHKGSIVCGKTIEYSRPLEESKAEILAFGIKELREQLDSTTKDIIVPFIPDQYDKTLRFHIALSGDKKKLLDLTQKNVEQYIQDKIKRSDKLNPDQRAVRILSELQHLLKLDNLPVVIDSFDNSNIQGTDAVAGCVVFRKGKPSKSDYKRFEIKTVVGADDYASMREVVRRRYQKLIDENAEMPSLIIADGGIGQMHAIREAVEDQLGLHIPIAGLKKDSHHRTQTLLYGFPPVEISVSVKSELFHLLTAIQDEVHRYAISYHKSKRSKHQIKSQLDELQGVGPATKQKILTYFGSLRRAQAAPEDEWIKLLGNAKGSAIYSQLQAQISL